MRKVAAGLLAMSVLLLLIAWQTQSSAARTLRLAYEMQSREVPESDAESPSIEDNKAVIEVLGESIGIRRDIDGLLQRVEVDVDYLKQSQVRARTTTDEVGNRLAEIAERLGAAARAATTSSSELGVLDGRLALSADLARAIARELAKLDRKLGPSVGRKP